MTASQVLQLVLVDFPREDVERLNMLFRLQTLVSGLETDLSTYQQRATGFQQQVTGLEGDIQRLTEEVVQLRGNQHGPQG